MNEQLQTKICEIYSKSKKSQSQIAREFNVSQTTVCKILKDNFIVCRNTRKYRFDETLFDNIDCEWKSYFLGFFIADGYHNESKHCLTLSIAYDDVEILEKFNHFIYNGKYQIRKYTRRKNEKDLVRITLYSKRVSNKFKSLGIRQKKSFTCGYPKCNLEGELFHHFVRGLIDGDGCISKSSKTGDYSIDLTTSPSLGNKLIKKFTKIGFNFKSTIRYYNLPLVILRLSGNRQCESFLNWLYQDATMFLTRKFNKYNELKHQTKQRNDPSRFKGYSFYSNRSKPYVVKIVKYKKIVYYECFSTENEAVSAYRSNKLKHEISVSSDS